MHMLAMERSTCKGPNMRGLLGDPHARERCSGNCSLGLALLHHACVAGCYGRAARQGSWRNPVGSRTIIRPSCSSEGSEAFLVVGLIFGLVSATGSWIKAPL